MTVTIYLSLTSIPAGLATLTLEIGLAAWEADPHLMMMMMMMLLLLLLLLLLQSPTETSICALIVSHCCSPHRNQYLWSDGESYCHYITLHLFIYLFIYLFIRPSWPALWVWSTKQQIRNTWCTVSLKREQQEKRDYLSRQNAFFKKEPNLFAKFWFSVIFSINVTNFNMLGLCP